MPVMYVFDAPLSKADYDKTRQSIGWEQNPPPGALGHAISFDDNGRAFAVDFWETPEDAERYYAGRLQPALQAAGAGAMPQARALELHLLAFSSRAPQYAVP